MAREDRRVVRGLNHRNDLIACTRKISWFKSEEGLKIHGERLLVSTGNKKPESLY